jgi:hypothetical protein
MVFNFKLGTITSSNRNKATDLLIVYYGKFLLTDISLGLHDSVDLPRLTDVHHLAAPVHVLHTQASLVKTSLVDPDGDQHQIER